MQNILPSSFSIEEEKWQSLYKPLVGPQKEHSRVKLLIKLNSFHITTRAVASLAFYTTKLQLLKLKFSVFLWKSNGKILSFNRSALMLEQPYIKIFFYLECPW